MRGRYRLIMIFIMCATFFLALPVSSLAAVFIETPPPEVHFEPVTLNGDLQNINGGEGNISVKATNLLGETWKVTVQGGPLKQTDGSGFLLPEGSLQLNTPVLESEFDCNYTIGEGPWFIDNEEPVMILEGGFYPLGLVLGWCTVRFEPAPFTLYIYPNKKIMDIGQTEATYETTITWTLTFIGL